MSDIPPVDRSKVMLTDGSPVPPDHSHTQNRGDGQQKGYIVLTDEERARGFVKPIRRSYYHIGPPELPTNLRDLTTEEHKQYDRFGYVKFEPYGSERFPLTGKYWTQNELNRAGKKCGGLTTMGRSLAETYARDPTFYSGTFCCHCGEHFALIEFEWEDGEPMDPSLQPAWEIERARQREEWRQHRIAQLRKELAELEAQKS